MKNKKNWVRDFFNGRIRMLTIFFKLYWFQFVTVHHTVIAGVIR